MDLNRGLQKKSGKIVQPRKRIYEVIALNFVDYKRINQKIYKPMEKQFNTPVLFLIFNRPDTTLRVFKAIRQVSPKYLYIAADGPRPDRIGEKEKCEATRAIIKQVDWDCEVKTLFREKNLGCGKAVSSAITWFFDNVEQGIILEDDCLPHEDFFGYCEVLLEYYKNKPKVMFIGGSNFQDGKKWGDASYYFSAINHVWGWASWRRAWQKYDFTLSKINELQFDAISKNYSKTISESNYWKKIFLRMKNNAIDTWDYQLLFSIWNASGISVIPNVNLISNIGFGDGATHTTGTNNKCSTKLTSPIFPITHPSDFSINFVADNRFYMRYNNVSLYHKTRRTFLRLIELTRYSIKGV
jgi:hypothetical protein